MNKALRKIRSLTAQASFAAATFAVMPAGMAQNAPAPKGPSAACAQQQKTINEKGLEKFSVPDLVAHPVLAGDTIKIQIRVRDALNKVGQSETCSIKLPAQEFRHPVSKAMVELRRTLAVSPKKSGDVAQRFGKLLQEQGPSVQNPQTLEALKALQADIAKAESNDALESGVRSMWELMQRLEQENMSAAEKRLREMEQALREALRRGADQEQIRELTSEAMKAMQDALKEQADKAKQNPQDPQAQKDFENMQKRLEEMQKMLDELQNVDKKTAQEMQKMMQQMQELMKQQQQMQQQQSQEQQDSQQQSQQQQNQQSQQQQQQQKMRQNMQQRMQQMQQRMQQQQQNQKMQQDMADMIKKQEELRNQTAEEREKRKEDMAAVLKQLEEYAKKLREQIQERRMEEYNNQSDMYRRRNNGNTAPADDFQMDGVSNDRANPFMMKVAYNGAFASKRAEALPPPRFDSESIQKRLERLGEMDRDVTGTAKGLEKKRIDQEQLRESEAESIIDSFQQIQRELQKQEKEQPQKPDKDQQQQSEQQNQQQKQQQQQEMLERIKQLMEQMKQKPQGQKKQQQQQQQNQQQSGQQQQQQKSMSQEQRDLQKQLQEMMNKMRQRGMDPGKLQEADKPMDQSAQELDQNDPGDAIPHQEEVLKNLREGQKQMQEQMQQQQQGQQPGQGQGDGQGEGEGDGEHEPSADALGRVPTNAEQLEFEKDAVLSQKRRAEIQRLLEGKNLPQATREYYERLLKGKNQRPSLVP